MTLKEAGAVFEDIKQRELLKLVSDLDGHTLDKVDYLEWGFVRGFKAAVVLANTLVGNDQK